MKFDYIPKDKLPSNILLCRGLYKCSVCGEITSYVEINYEGYFCSEECLEKFDKKYFQAEKKFLTNEEKCGII